MLKGHGADTHNYSHIVADFSSNVSWVDYTAVLNPIVSEAISELQTYPDVEYSELCGELARSHGLTTRHFVVTNGAVAGIYQCAQAFAEVDGKSGLFYPEFSEYECALRMYGHELEFAEVGDFTSFSEDCRFVMLGNPNNPLGVLQSRRRLVEFLQAHSETIVVIDESYMEFTGGSESMIPLVNEHENLIVIKSFTKRYSIPGLRLGYIVAQPQVCMRLNQWSQPWSVNTLASAVGCKILQSPECFPFDTVAYVAEKKRFFDELTAIDQLSVQWSEVNYFLLRIDDFIVADLKYYLVNEWQLLVRDASNFRGLDEHSMRVAVRSYEDNEKLLKALRKFFSEDGRGV